MMVSTFEVLATITTMNDTNQIETGDMMMNANDATTNNFVSASSSSSSSTTSSVSAIDEDAAAATTTTTIVRLKGLCDKHDDSNNSNSNSNSNSNTNTNTNTNTNSNSNSNINTNSNSNEDDKQHHLYDDDGDTGNLPSSQTIRRRKRSHTIAGIPLHLLVGPAPGRPRPRPRRTERTTHAMEICSASASSSVVSFNEAVTMHHVENYRYSLLPTEKQTVWYTSWEMTRLMAAHGRSRRRCGGSGSAQDKHEHEDGDKEDDDAMEVEQQHQRQRRHQQMQKRQKDTRTRQIMEENNRRNQEFLMSLNRRFSIGESSTKS